MFNLGIREMIVTGGSWRIRFADNQIRFADLYRGNWRLLTEERWINLGN